MNKVEPLINKYAWGGDKWKNKNEAELHRSNSIFFFNDVKSAVEFFRRYRWNNLKLQKEKPDIYKLYEQVYVDNPMSIPHPDIECLEIYEQWLLNYCFADVIEAD